MKKLLLLLLFSVFMASCGGPRHLGKTPEPLSTKRDRAHKPIRKVAVHKTSEPAEALLPDATETKDNNKNITREIIAYAKTFEGTRYKFGGTTKAGMDCSGLVCTAFQKENIDLPRISRDMAKQGVLVSFKDIVEGDLVFFKTSSRNVINHVGLVVEAKRGEVKFIHSTTRAGVIISSLDEDYWKKAFVEVRRVI